MSTQEQPVVYDRDYFIKKFEAIPSREIGILTLNDHCALWHVGCRYDGKHGADYIFTEEALALIKLFGGNDTRDIKVVYQVNDNSNRIGETPKDRILNKLRSL